MGVYLDPLQPLPDTQAEHHARSQASSANNSKHALSTEVIWALKHCKMASPDSPMAVHKSVSECGHIKLSSTPVNYNIVAALTAYDENMRIKQCIQFNQNNSIVFWASIHGQDVLVTLLEV